MAFKPDDEMRSREQLVGFLRELRREFGVREWENGTLEAFLEALAAWVEDSPGAYRNAGEVVPPRGDWTFMARALRAAADYE
ncbi:MULTISPECIES: DUF7660 family protein [unclassified Streptomyces]|uniref:DUF7660 family protein n=1 Tax=unclassified Streptomyces TaxID=2593676 RepID=UPI0006C6E7F5|nr:MULTISPECIES: hypothetical protein [unclassified Streptomyces]KOX37236.1 hypothetical protein ADL06_03630 [Streptomyces sp. NRRL F-6491]KOX40997.1 hypothetical protein ADL08_20800 [Streptomyces sp. NRRL F-6492]